MSAVQRIFEAAYTRPVERSGYLSVAFSMVEGLLDLQLSQHSQVLEEIVRALCGLTSHSWHARASSKSHLPAHLPCCGCSVILHCFTMSRPAPLHPHRQMLLPQLQNLQPMDHLRCQRLTVIVCNAAGRFQGRFGLLWRGQPGGSTVHSETAPCGSAIPKPWRLDHADSRLIAAFIPQGHH